MKLRIGLIIAPEKEQEPKIEACVSYDGDYLRSLSDEQIGRTIRQAIGSGERFCEGKTAIFFG